MDVKTFISDFNKRYAELHSAYERQFWSSKMALSDADNEKLTSTKTALDLFLGDRETLAQVRKYLQEPGLDDDDIKVLKCFEKTFLCYLVEDPEALALKDEIGRLEAELAQSRNRMSLGYKNSEGEFVTASSVALRNAMRSSEDPVVRLSCYEGMRSIGKFVAGPFAEIVKKRNAFAKKCGYVDFYDMKVTQAEGFSKDTLFGILDGLERDTRPIMQAALAQLASTKGADAIKAENIGFALAGDTTKLKDPYFPFENAVDVWARSFAAMNISYRGSTMQLDLCDRQGKYSNGFCHWPVCAYVDNKTGEFTPAQTNFTSLASPKSVGSGFTAITTLMHEAGHAAHFSNVVQKSPLFSQERAPTSVAYAENQSMFLDSLVSDAAWCSRYALDVNGNPIPFSVLEQEARNTHAYKVLALRAMISVPYFEKKLYELPEDQVTPENIISLADEVEADIQGVLSPRPLLSVPHILADESSCYYHGKWGNKIKLTLKLK